MGVASGVAWVLAGCLGSLAYELLLWMSRLTNRDPDWEGLMALTDAGLAIIVAGAVIGAVQWLVLRQLTAGTPGRWIRASTVGWALGLSLSPQRSRSASSPDNWMDSMTVTRE